MDESGKWKDLKNWLNIQDDNNKSNKNKTNKFVLVYNAIKVREKDWFTSDNLLELLKKIKECKIDVDANNVYHILTVFKNNNPGLKFNNISKHALELIKDNSLTNDSIEREWNNFCNLLELLNDNLVLDDVLKKIKSFTIPQMTNLLEIWNKKDTKKKEDVVAILDRVKDVSDKSSKNATYMAALLEQLNKICKLSELDHPQDIPDQILNKLDNWQIAKGMCSLAKQLKGCLTVNHTKIILEKKFRPNAKDMCELIEQLPLEASHCDLIFDKLSESKAGDLLKLVEKLAEIGFNFDKNSYKKVLRSLGNRQTVDDICDLLAKLNGIGVTLETNLVHDIVDKLQFDSDVDNVYKLLDDLRTIGVKLGENTAVCIVNKLKSGLTLDNVSTLLEKFRNINVQLNSNMDGKDNVVDAIVKKLQSPQSAEDLLNLVKTLQELNIQPIANTCKQILNLLDGDQNAGYVANLLIDLGNLVGFKKIQANTTDYLPGIDDILNKIATNQSEGNIVILAEMLIAMGKNLKACEKDFRNKLADKSDKLEKLLALKYQAYGYTDYNGKQLEFVEKFKQKIKPKESEEKSNEKRLIYDNFQNNNILNVDPVDLKEKENVNLGSIEEKPTNEAGNKKAVLKILGGIFAILGILCIISSLIIAESVLLGLLIPGCGLLTAGIISILVGLFLNNKNDKPPINLPSGNRQDGSVISNQGDNIEPSINLETNQDIIHDDNEF